MRKIFYIILVSVLVLNSCKTQIAIEKKFKNNIQENYSKKVCFKKDSKNEVVKFISNIYASRNKKFFEISKNELSEKFDDDSTNNCGYIALTEYVNDSVITAVVYPYKSDINQDLKGYSHWFYEPIIYLGGYTEDRNVFSYDTLRVKHNPPLLNPWIKIEDRN